MSKTVREIMVEANITWDEFFALFDRGKMGRERIKKLTERRLPGGWLFELGACEALRRASNLQTDLEDFCGSPQQPQVPATSEVRSV